ncbi:hypothetical protein BN85411270 [Alteracholeplasma palmae J233]|uniref:DUF4760 domain-containing protein n=1 Tax=Alteracholeplasma palmae (strain ATCC 49389 / J233) TaxID=1318466 RepID=U4KLB5_ALTPJ|nr:hypothetical protein [Alteracholeplasma palmae]CCV64704.1 hypothetical protein BN85411270 [Alteracholeplasma palmae J233]
MEEFLREWGSLLLSSLIFIWTILSFFILYKQNKKIAYLSNKLEKNKHISNTQFDIEIAIYKEISSQLFKTYLDVYALYPQGIYNEDNDIDKRINNRKELYRKAANSFGVYQDLIRSYEPFINEKIFIQFTDIANEMKDQIVMYPDYRIREDAESFMRDSGHKLIYSFKKTKEISKKRDDLMKSIRKHLEDLKSKTI